MVIALLSSMAWAGQFQMPAYDHPCDVAAALSSRRGWTIHCERSVSEPELPAEMTEGTRPFSFDPAGDLDAVMARFVTPGFVYLRISATTGVLLESVLAPRSAVPPDVYVHVDEPDDLVVEGYLKWPATAIDGEVPRELPLDTLVQIRGIGARVPCWLLTSSVLKTVARARNLDETIFASRLDKLAEIECDVPQGPAIARDILLSVLETANLDRDEPYYYVAAPFMGDKYRITFETHNPGPS